MDFQKSKSKAERLRPAIVSKALFQEVRRIEDDLINLNVSQIEDYTDSFGNALKNTNKRYNGVYSKLTEDLSKMDKPLAPKKEGEPYNFLWTGDFLSGFELRIENETVSLRSTGTGTDGKLAFFSGYKNLFGLTDESLNKVVNESLLPFFIEYYRNELT